MWQLPATFCHNKGIGIWTKISPFQEFPAFSQWTFIRADKSAINRAFKPRFTYALDILRRSRENRTATPPKYFSISTLDYMWLGKALQSPIKPWPGNPYHGLSLSETPSHPGIERDPELSLWEKNWTYQWNILFVIQKILVVIFHITILDTLYKLDSFNICLFVTGLFHST